MPSLVLEADLKKQEITIKNTFQLIKYLTFSKTKISNILKDFMNHLSISMNQSLRKLVCLILCLEVFSKSGVRYPLSSEEAGTIMK